MLSSILNSEKAVRVNIEIIRIFTKVRQLLADNTHLHLELSQIKLTLEKITNKQDGHDKNIDLLFTYIDRLQEKIEEPEPIERKSIGYKLGKEK